jgi:hypothetical protein
MRRLLMLKQLVQRVLFVRESDIYLPAYPCSNLYLYVIFPHTSGYQYCELTIFNQKTVSVLPCILYKNIFLEMFTHNSSLFVTVIIYTKLVFILPNITLFIPRVVLAILYVHQDKHTIELYIVNKIKLSYIFERQIAVLKQMSFKGIYNIITSILHVQC